MVDTSDVAGLNAFDLLDTESDRVDRYFATLDEDGWRKPTRCEGWRTRELLSHLAGVETYHLACLNDTIPALMEEASKEGVKDVHSFNEWAVRIRGSLSLDVVLAEWRKKNAEVRKRFRELGPDGTMSSMVGPYPADLMAFHVASEYATHADDMAVDVPGAEKAQRNGWRAKISRFAIKENEKPVTVEQKGADYVVRSGDSEATLSEADFVEAVTARATSVPLDPALRDALVALA